MKSSKLSDELRRFIHSIDSIPHLEAMLLLRSAHTQVWDKDILAQHLYLNVELANTVLNDLCAAGICESITNSQNKFTYAPANEINALITQLADYYSHNLIEVTHMIHAKTNAGQRVQQFADAFKFNRD